MSIRHTKNRDSSNILLYDTREIIHRCITHPLGPSKIYAAPDSSNGGGQLGGFIFFCSAAQTTCFVVPSIRSTVQYLKHVCTYTVWDCFRDAGGLGAFYAQRTQVFLGGGSSVDNSPQLCTHTHELRRLPNVRMRSLKKKGLHLFTTTGWRRPFHKRNTPRKMQKKKKNPRSPARSRTPLFLGLSNNKKLSYLTSGDAPSLPASPPRVTTAIAPPLLLASP